MERRGVEINVQEYYVQCVVQLMVRSDMGPYVPRCKQTVPVHDHPYTDDDKYRPETPLPVISTALPTILLPVLS